MIFTLIMSIIYTMLAIPSSLKGFDFSYSSMNSATVTVQQHVIYPQPPKITSALCDFWYVVPYKNTYLLTYLHNH